MDEEPGEQQELEGSPPVPESRTRQEQIMDLYNSTSLPHIAIGYWAKVLAEVAIVAPVIALLVLIPGFVLAYLDILTYFKVLALWATFTGSVFYASWCFTESANISVDEAVEGETENAQD